MGGNDNKRKPEGENKCSAHDGVVLSEEKSEVLCKNGIGSAAKWVLKWTKTRICQYSVWEKQGRGRLDGLADVDKFLESFCSISIQSCQMCHYANRPSASRSQRDNNPIYDQKSMTGNCLEFTHDLLTVSCRSNHDNRECGRAIR